MEICDFTKKIDILFDVLDCTNSDIARLAECSPSEVSRLHSGARRHRPDSRPVQRFADGVCAMAQQKGLEDSIAALCGHMNSDGLPTALINWLFGPESPPQEYISAKKNGAQRHRRMSFGGRLNRVMNVLGLSNVWLAQKINVDASAISRFRSGLRQPSQPISQLLVSALLLRAGQAGKVEELSALCGIPEERLDEGALSEWLFGGDTEPAICEINSLLGSIYKAINRPPVQLPPIDLTLPDCSNSAYTGVDGLREAVVRFLTEAAVQGGELWLYSDQDTKWLFGDGTFTAKWTALMSACLASGVKIRIIHNIDRGTSEMLAAIQNWLPLYMSGLIEPYACPSSASLFCHTLFIRPGAECISGFCVKGGEEGCRYDYLTDRADVNAVEGQFCKLLSISSPLAKVVRGERKRGGTLYRLAAVPSLATLPEETLEAMIARCDPQQREAICVFRKHESACECELFTLPPAEAFDSGVKASVPVWLSGKLCYTQQEYMHHIAAARAAVSTHYRAGILSELPLSGLEIEVSASQASVTYADNPTITFEFFDYRMVRAFRAYIKTLYELSTAL